MLWLLFAAAAAQLHTCAQSTEPSQHVLGRQHGESALQAVCVCRSACFTTCKLHGRCFGIQLPVLNARRDGSMHYDSSLEASYTTAEATCALFVVFLLPRKHIHPERHLQSQSQLFSEFNVLQSPRWQSKRPGTILDYAWCFMYLFCHDPSAVHSPCCFRGAHTCSPSSWQRSAPGATASAFQHTE